MIFRLVSLHDKDVVSLHDKDVGAAAGMAAMS
jgi:hypothetical protein